MRTLAVVLLVVLAGCGGGSEPTDNPTATKAATKATAKPTTKPTIVPPSGTPAPEALSDFRCLTNAKGVWRAGGTISNKGKTKATYQVTVFIGEATGSDESAKTKQLLNIQAGGSATFVIAKVPATGDEGPCHVQVLRR